MLRDSLAKIYLSKSDDELLSLAADPDSLVEEARPILTEELGRRGLTVAPVPAVVESQARNLWSGAVGKVTRSAGDYLLCFALAVLGSNAILQEINPIVHAHRSSGWPQRCGFRASQSRCCWVFSPLNIGPRGWPCGYGYCPLDS
jgi:hypothetical protein